MAQFDYESGLGAWQNVTERLHHENNLLNERMYNFSTVQAFLTAALAFSSSGGRYSADVLYLVALFGLVLALFYIPLGLGYVRGIEFLHRYLMYLESHPGVTRVNTIIFDLLGTGRTKIDGRKNAIVEGGWWARRAIRQVFPWYLPGLSASSLIGVGTPLLATAFWLLVLSVLLGWVPAGFLGRVAGVLVPALVLLFAVNLALGRLVPGHVKLVEEGDESHTGNIDAPGEGRAV
jgi:hypothetical protein